MLVATGGCGIAPDSAPRDVAPAERNLTVNAVSDGDEAGGTSRIYLVAPSEAGDPSLLRSTSRDVASGATPLIKSLLAGPNPEELASRLVTNIPQETQLLSTDASGDVLSVDVSPEITELSGDLLVLAVAQIVFTATEIEGIRAVRLRVERPGSTMAERRRRDTRRDAHRVRLPRPRRVGATARIRPCRPPR